MLMRMNCCGLLDINIDNPRDYRTLSPPPPVPVLPRQEGVPFQRVCPGIFFFLEGAYLTLLTTCPELFCSLLSQSTDTHRRRVLCRSTKACWPPADNNNPSLCFPFAFLKECLGFLVPVMREDTLLRRNSSMLATTLPRTTVTSRPLHRRANMATNNLRQASNMAISSRLHKATTNPHRNSNHRNSNHRNNNHNTDDRTCRP